MPFDFFSRKKAAGGLVGLDIREQGIALCHCLRDAPPQLQICEFIECEANPTARAEALKSRVDELQLQQADCNVVLGFDHYNLLLVEAPKVDPSELRAAVRWRIKDLIDFHIDDAVVDVFDLPKTATRGGAPLMYAIAARQSVVMSAIDLIEACELKLQSIDITEMAMRNLSLLAEQDARGLALLNLQAGAGVLSLIRNENLYFSRRFDLKYGGGLFDELPLGQLVLEIQRSLDYYERQMGQVPPAAIWVCGENMNEDKIPDNLREQLAAEVSCFEPGDWMPFAKPFDELVVQQCIAALGASLRREQVVL